MTHDTAPHDRPSSNAAPYRWWRDLTRYHWFVLAVAALGWLFDCLDQQLFTLARVPAMTELLRVGETPASPGDVARYGGYATSIFLLGWATGGLFFGVLGDKIGRARTMLWTILLYSLCTGLSALSKGFADFAFYRFITGLGVGGEFAVGVALVAEVMPDRARPYAIGLLQALSAVGNISAALINIGLGELEHVGMSRWRIMFLIGALPALLAVVIRARLKEPERWTQVATSGPGGGRQLGSYGTLFSHPVWRRRAFAGLGLAVAGVVGLWGIGFFTPDLLRLVLTKSFTAEGMSPPEVAKHLFRWTGIALIVQNVAGFLGIYSFGVLSQRIGRRPTFAITFVGALLATVLVFSTLETRRQIFWMIPMMGFFQFALFGGYAIYFPELFPTSIRSTGVSFCYNVGRFIAATGPTLLGLLTSVAFREKPEPMRYAGVTMCAVFLLGLAVLPFAPETRGTPLPEEDRGLVH
ncbi:MAG TPA: MFS transporter [Verrucomicrobiales bacterium]|nr:MFS transporter [Verrucomicrobiales bacterium]